MQGARLDSLFRELCADFYGERMPGETLQTYFRNQQVALQWLPILRAMAVEMPAYADPASLRKLFFSIGQRVAADAAPHFEQVQTIDDLEQALNAFWMPLNWGWVNLSEVADGIDIAHHAAPLAEAFGEQSLEWSVGLMEGYYQSVFAVLGAQEQMMVRSLGSDEDGMNLRLRLAF